VVRVEQCEGAKKNIRRYCENVLRCPQVVCVLLIHFVCFVPILATQNVFPKKRHLALVKQPALFIAPHDIVVRVEGEKEKVYDF